MSKESNGWGNSTMFNPLVNLTAARHSYEKLLNAKAAIMELEEDEYCYGIDGTLDLEITIRRLDRSIAECKDALRKAEQQYFGV